MKSTSFLKLAAFNAAVLLSSCSSSEIGNSKDVNPETVYQQYLLSYNEEKKNVEGLAVFRFAGEDGTTLVLSEPSKIAFDNDILKVDSNDFAGAFYAFKSPAAGFNGKHQLSFTGLTGLTYTNEFDAAVPKIEHLPVRTQKWSPIPIVLSGLADGEYAVEVNSVDTDSSFTINSSSADKPGYLEIPVSELVRQKEKKLSLNISVSRKIPLQHTTKEGGSLMVLYNFKPVEIILDERVPLTRVDEVK